MVSRGMRARVVPCCSCPRPAREDDRLFDQARLVNAAMMAKLHTVEWTPAVLQHPVAAYGLNGNWWRAFGKSGSRLFRRFTRWDVLRGIPGSRKDPHGAPYSLTEEFVAVYRSIPCCRIKSRSGGGRPVGRS